MRQESNQPRPSLRFVRDLADPTAEIEGPFDSSSVEVARTEAGDRHPWSGAGRAPDMKYIFRCLIEEEARSGRLTAWRRRRIVRYAAQLGLSAVEAGRLIERCRRNVSACDGSDDDLQTSRPATSAADLAAYRAPTTKPPFRRANVLLALSLLAIAVELLVIGWLR